MAALTMTTPLLGDTLTGAPVRLRGARP